MRHHQRDDKGAVVDITSFPTTPTAAYRSWRRCAETVSPLIPRFLERLLGNGGDQKGHRTRPRLGKVPHILRRGSQCLDHRHGHIQAVSRTEMDSFHYLLQSLPPESSCRRTWRSMGSWLYVRRQPGRHSSTLCRAPLPHLPAHTLRKSSFAASAVSFEP